MDNVTTATLTQMLSAIMNMISGMATIFGTDEKQILEFLTGANEHSLSKEQQSKMN